MPRTFLEPGAAATNWKLAGSMPSRVSDQDPNNGSINAAQVTISWGLPFPYSGWQITIYETTPTSVSMPSSPVYTVHISSPLTGINQTYSGDDWEFYIDGWELTATECEAWSAEFTELRLYVDGALVLTVAGNSYAGVGYDTRQRKPRVQALSFNVGEDFTPQYLCGGTELDRSLSMSCTARLAYWWWNGAAWVAENIEIDTGMALPATTPPSGCGACTCAGTLPSISGTTTAQVDTTSEWYYLCTAVRGADRECQCAVTGELFTFQYWDIDQEFRQKSSWVDVVAEHETLLHETLRTRAAGCTCQFPLLDGESTVVEAQTTEALTYCQSFQQTIRWTTDNRCTFGDFICPETALGEPQSYNCGPILSEAMCYYSGYVMLTWPDSLCGGSCCATLDIAPNGRMYTAYLLTATNAVLAGYASTGFMSDGSAIAWQVFDAGFTADALNIRYDRVGADPQLWLVYEDGGTIYRRSSEDHGESWSVATTIATGANPTHDPIESGLRYVYWRDGTALKGQIFDTEWNTVVAAFTATGVTLDSDSTVETKVHGGGAGQVVVVVTYKDGGNVKYAYSRNGQAFV